MRGDDAVGHEDNPRAVVLSAPGFARGEGAEFESAVHFRVRERLVSSIAPAETPENANFRRDRLLKIQAETIFVAPLDSRGDDVRRGSLVIEVIVDRLAVVAHIGVV